MSVRARVASVAASVAILVGATAGVTYAATATSVPSNDYATACSNSLHTLRLAGSKGTCPSGYSPIDLASAPTPLAVNASDLKTHDETVSVENFAFTAVCAQNKDAQEVAVLAMKSATGFDVQGTDVFTGNNVAQFITPRGSVPTGAGQISFAAPGAKQSDFVVYQSGGVTGSALIIQSGHTIAVTFALFSYPGSCSVQAQMTPSD